MRRIKIGSVITSLAMYCIRCI